MTDATIDNLDALKEKGFEVRFLSHAQAILSVDFPDTLQEIKHALETLTIPIEEIIGSGGGEAKGTQRLRRALDKHGWHKKTFEIKKIINGVQREAISHIVDHVREVAGKGVIALEIEWNNKDPFFDRDLENFKRLHAEGAISVGIIVTRGATLQDNIRNSVRRFVDERKIGSFDDLEPFGIAPTRRQRDAVAKRTNRANEPLSFAEAWTDHFVGDKYGAATTHWRKLDDRVQRGVGNPCPLLLIGLPTDIVTFGESRKDISDILKEINED